MWELKIKENKPQSKNLPSYCKINFRSSKNVDKDVLGPPELSRKLQVDSEGQIEWDLAE